MKNLPNPIEILLRIENLCLENKKRDDMLEKRLIMLEEKISETRDKNDFNIKTIAKAIEILCCSKDILRAAMKNGMDHNYSGRTLC